MSTGDEFVETVSRQETAPFDATLFLSIGYAVVALIVMGAILFTLKKIKQLISSNPLQELGDIRFINTDAKGTPFSFFRYIFWNHKIDLQSETGQHIFNHELAHVKRKAQPRQIIHTGIAHPLLGKSHILAYQAGIGTGA